MRLFAILLLSAIFVFAVACSGGSESPTPVGLGFTTPVANPTATPEAIVTSFEGDVVEFEVNLAINGSPQQGTAVFTRRDDTSRLVIMLRPGVAAQMVTLRRGECPSPVGFEESLDLAIGGILRQDLRDYSIEDLTAGDLTLVISANDDEFNVFAACADLPKLE